MARGRIPDLERPGRLERPYVLGTALWASAVVAISVGVLWLGTGWEHPLRWAIIGFGVALLVAYRAWERRRRVTHPADLQVDRRPVTVALFAGVVIALAQSAPMLILPQYFAIVPRFGPVFGMLAIAPLIAGLVIAGPVAGFLLARFPPRVLVAAGLVTVGLGNIAVALIAGPATGYVLFILPLLLIGVGFVVGTTVRTAIIFASVPRGLPATAAALNEASLAVGTRIGIVLVTAIVATVALEHVRRERQRAGAGRGRRGAAALRGRPVRGGDAVVPGARARHPARSRDRVPRRLRRRGPHGAVPRWRGGGAGRDRRVAGARPSGSAGDARHRCHALGLRAPRRARERGAVTDTRPMSDPGASPLRIDRVPLEDQPGVLVVLTLDRPAVMNAIDDAMLAALHAALDEVETDAGVRAVVVAGAGERAFCAGMDLKERAGFSDDDLRAQRALIVGLIRRLHELPVPTIAAVDGVALGGGFELALACDLIVAGAGATFGLPEVKVGIFPGGGSTQTLTWLVGPARARDVILTGRRLSAAEAEAWGVAARVVDAGAARDDGRRARAVDRRGRAARHPPGEGGDPGGPPRARRRPRGRERALRDGARQRGPSRGVHGVRREAPAAVHRPLAHPMSIWDAVVTPRRLVVALAASRR